MTLQERLRILAAGRSRSNAPELVREAADRIDELEKALLTIAVRGEECNPLPQSRVGLMCIHARVALAQPAKGSKG